MKRLFCASLLIRLVLVAPAILASLQPLYAQQASLSLSKRSDFSSEDRSFTNKDTLYIKVVAPQIDHANLDKNKLTLTSAAGNGGTESSLKNNKNGTFTQYFPLGSLDFNQPTWTVEIRLEDDHDFEFRQTTTFTLSEAPNDGGTGDGGTGDGGTGDGGTGDGGTGDGGTGDGGTGDGGTGDGETDNGDNGETDNGETDNGETDNGDNGQPNSYFQLHPNYPNPFNTQTTIQLDLFESGPLATRMAIYDVIGREIAVLVDADLNTGRHIFEWTPASDALANGVYFCRLEINGFTQTRTMILQQ